MNLQLWYLRHILILELDKIKSVCEKDVETSLNEIYRAIDQRKTELFESINVVYNTKRDILGTKIGVIEKETNDLRQVKFNYFYYT